jgi:hypothetical protein
MEASEETWQRLSGSWKNKLPLATPGGKSDRPREAFPRPVDVSAETRLHSPLVPLTVSRSQTIVKTASCCPSEP